MQRPGSMTLAMARRVLGVTEAATPEELRAAYAAAVKSAHPDLGGTSERLALTLEAWRLIGGRAEPSPGGWDGGSHEAVDRLEITPVIAVAGGRMVTRLPDGRKAALTLPAGLRQGDKIVASGTRLTIAIKGRPDMFVSGDDLCLTVRATPAIMRDGGHMKLKTPMGSRMVWVPKQVGTNHIVRIAGQGLPAAGRHAQGALVLKLILAGKDTPLKVKRRRFSSGKATA